MNLDSSVVIKDQQDLRLSSTILDDVEMTGHSNSDKHLSHLVERWLSTLNISVQRKEEAKEAKLKKQSKFLRDIEFKETRVEPKEA